MINFDVAYYDDEEETLFRRSGAAQHLDPLVANGLAIDELDLIARGMFMEQKNKPGWRSREDLEDKALSRIDQFEQYFDTSGGSLVAQHDAGDMGVNTEWMGVGASIAAMDEAYGTNDADWEMIPVSGDKDLDFHVASTGSHMVVVESKGSVVEDVRYKTPSVSNHKGDIKKKKAVQRPKRPGDTLIGTVTAIPVDLSQRARIWLVDPPMPEDFGDPVRFKLLARLRYYRELLHVLGRPHVLIALSTRIAALERLGDVSRLDGAALVNADEKVFDVPPSFIQDRSHSFDERFSVVAWPAPVGLVVVGLDLELIRVVAKQSHADLLAWSSRHAGRRQRDFMILLEPAQGDGIAGLRPAGRIRRDGRRPTAPPLM